VPQLAQLPDGEYVPAEHGAHVDAYFVERQLS
jgi:hypothetical protein